MQEKKTIVNQPRDYEESVKKYTLRYSKRDDFYLMKFLSLPILEKGHWLWSYYVDQDIAKAKQHMYRLGMLLDRSTNVRYTSQFGTHWRTNVSLRTGPDIALLSMLLSDNPDLLQRFIDWPYDPIDLDGATYKPVIGMVLVVKALLGGDRRLAQVEFNKYKEDLGNESNDKYFEIDIPILESMMEGDIDKYESAIVPLCDVNLLKKRRQFGHIHLEYLAAVPTFLTKAMWILGHEVHIDHPLIPMDLMPIKPLERYTVPYFFLDGYAGELPENYAKWLAERSDEDVDTTPIQPQRSEVTSEYDPFTYSSPSEQKMIEIARSQGLEVIGDKDNGWKIIKDIEK